MFPLNTESFPASAAELKEALSESLRRFFTLPAEPVTMLGGDYPAIDQLTISLNGAQLRPDAKRPALVDGEAMPALQVREFTMSGRGISMAGVCADVSVNADGVRLSSGKSKSGEVVLVFQTAVSGRVQVSAAQAALQTAIAQIATAEAGKHGVTIDNVRLKLDSTGPRAFSAEVQLRARKLFLSATLRVRAQLAIDEALTAKVSGLRCEGDGALASIACGVLAPHLEKLDGREFPLMALPLGDIRLRDVQLAIGPKIVATAEFGAA